MGNFRQRPNRKGGVEVKVNFLPRDRLDNALVPVLVLYHGRETLTGNNMGICGSVRHPQDLDPWTHI